jgi:hypothetical protein
MSRFTTATLALLLAPGLLQAAAPQTLWDFAPSSHIRRIAAEKGAPANSQPLKVDAATLARALGGVRFMAKADKEELLFIPSEAVAIGDAMGEALALAQPGEDLELLSAANRGRGVFSSNRTVTARVFVLDGKLNLIVREARLDVLNYPSFTDNAQPRFDYGSRAKAGGVVLKAPGAQAPRADWLVLPLDAAPPAPTAAPVQAPPEPPPARAGSVEERLRDLKRFRDQGLITEAEYAQSKQDLLKTFSSAQ